MYSRGEDVALSFRLLKHVPTYSIFLILQNAWNGDSALMIASEEGHTAIVQRLIEAKVDLNQRDKVKVCVCTCAEGEGPWYSLMRACCLEFITQRGRTALMLASNFGHVAIVQALIEAKADLNLQDLVCW